MKFLIILLLTFLMTACGTTDGIVKNNPYSYGQTAGAIYIIVGNDIDPEKLIALKKSWDILNMVVDFEIPEDLSVEAQVDKLILEYGGDYIGLINAFIKPRINKMKMKFNFNMLSKNGQIEVLNQFRNGIRSVIMDNVEELPEENHNGLMITPEPGLLDIHRR